MLIINIIMASSPLTTVPMLFTVRGNYEDVVTALPRKQDFTRSESENWRSSQAGEAGEDDEDDEGGLAPGRVSTEQ